MVTLEFRGLVGEGSAVSSAMLGLSDDTLQVVLGASGEIAKFELVEDAVANFLTLESLDEGAASLGLTEAYFDDEDRVWLWGNIQDRVLVYDYDSLTAVTLGDMALKISGKMMRYGNDFLVSGPEGNNLNLMSSVGSEKFALIDTYLSGPKDSITDISELLAVQIGQREFAVAASYSGNGLSCFERLGDELVLVDSIGAKDGVWIAGVTDLELVEVAGEVFILATSQSANTVVSLRLNAQGVFFTADQLWDTRETRFGGASDLAGFEWLERDFTILGGNDLGLSLIEVLPGGWLFHHAAIPQSADWNVGATADLVAKVIGEEAQVFMTGTSGNGIAQMTVDLSRTGGRQVGTDGADVLSGGWKDDLIVGGAGSDSLIGKAGDDVLIDGAGSDVLTGENGADVFVFVADGHRDMIADFVQGEDRIHLGGWGQIYAWTALDIHETTYGAKIIWGDEILNIYTKNNRPIEIASWDADDFIF